MGGDGANIGARACTCGGAVLRCAAHFPGRPWLPNIDAGLVEPDRRVMGEALAMICRLRSSSTWPQFRKRSWEFSTGAVVPWNTEILLTKTPHAQCTDRAMSSTLVQPWFIPRHGIADAVVGCKWSRTQKK